MINRILIIEDERLNADRLKRLLGEVLPNALVLNVLNSVKESVNWLVANGMPDVLFMDVRLSDGLSFEIFERIRISCPVIFTTSYDEYAVQAFKYNGVDYLLKPVELDELRSAIGRIDHKDDYLEMIDKLREYVKPKEYKNRLLIPYKDGYRVVLVKEVRYLYLEHRILRARLLDGSEVVVPHGMEELEHQLDPRFFFRINRQYLVHAEAIDRIHNYFNGKLKVTLKDSPEEVVVSREKAVALKQWIDI
ncbi:LytR/AlgR family response regulator transcription factor [Pedobacter helvus]|uniref:LytR/AlgR family response regulator transcription factor n=1 Tax=Pedobacter helvus TaxID=2563444 RepID=A0ABW9JJN4_9SPHI|nr:LytTR family DNA-binding domain-containing protein [Pedobacter ureilyticus]